jgi:DNA-directed RNA polymerase specialized sigma24 family protein
VAIGLAHVRQVAAHPTDLTAQRAQFSAVRADASDCFVCHKRYLPPPSGLHRRRAQSPPLSFVPDRPISMPFRRLKDYELANLPDEDLIAYAVAARDAGDVDAMRDALAILVFRRYDDLVRRAKLKVPAGEAEDIAAQTIDEAILVKFRGTSVGEFMKIVGQILRRRIADFLEKRKRTIQAGPLPEENTDDEDVHGRTAGITPDSTGAVEVEDLIERLMANLSPPHRRVVELYVFDALSAEDAADQLNADFPDLDTTMSVDNVHKIASRFRKDLRKALEDSD